MKKETALITGASSGIGLELARQFAGGGYRLVLVARVQSELETVATEMRQNFGVAAEVIARDLSRPEAAGEIFEALEHDGKQIDILVNNAGLGQKGKFWETPLERDIEMIRVNIETLTRLTKLFLPPMVQRNHGKILNVSSVAGFEPCPLLAVYHATKAYVLSFSEAIATELEETNVTVTALCPGVTDTDFYPKADMIATRAFQKTKVMTPREVAREGYEALMRGDLVFVPGMLNKTLAFSRRLLTEHAQAKLNEKFYEEVQPEDRKHKLGDYEAKEEAR